MIERNQYLNSKEKPFMCAMSPSDWSRAKDKYPEAVTYYWLIPTAVWILCVLLGGGLIIYGNWLVRLFGYVMGGYSFLQLGTRAKSFDHYLDGYVVGQEDGVCKALDIMSDHNSRSVGTAQEAKRGQINEKENE